MKKINNYVSAGLCLTALLLLSLTASTPCMAGESNSVELGFCDTTGAGIKTMSADSEGVYSGGSAIYFPASDIASFAGAEITEIKIKLDGEPTSLKMFVAKSLNGTYDYEQELTGGVEGWNTFTLDTPFAIDGTDLYVGYEETGLQYLSYPARAKDGTEYYCTPLGSGWQTYTQYYAAGILITVEGDDLPLYDVSLDSSIMPDYVVTGEPYASSHSITNKGLATVESVELTYTVGDEQYTETIEGLDIANGESGYFTAETVLFDEEGEDNVTVSITKINGNNDRDTSDNASRTVNVISRKEFVQRNMLVEMFSTMNCKDCPEGDEAVMAIIADMDNVVQVCHHTADGYDDYTISESEQYQWFYKHNAFAPSVMLDRTCLYNEVPYSYTKPNNNFYADSPVIGTGNAFNSDLFHIQAAKPAYATVNITTALDDSTVKVNISGNKILTIDEDKEYHLTVFVVEDSLITTKQNGYTGKFVYNGSPRLALSDAWGDEIDLVNGYDKDYEFTLSDEWDINHVRVVAFVGEYDEYDKCGHRVLNTAQAWLVEKEEEGETTAIENAAAAADAVRVAGNTIILPEGTTQLDIFNAAGLLLTSTAPTGNAYALSGLGAGVYVARVKTAAGVQTVKFTVF